VKKRRKPSSKARAGRPRSLRKINKAAGPPTPEESAELAKALRTLVETPMRAFVEAVVRPRPPEVVRVPRITPWWERPAFWKRLARTVKPANPKGGRKAKVKAAGRPKFDLVLTILADIKPAPGLPPAEVEKKVLPVFRGRWAKLKPDDKTDPPVSRTTIYRAYQEYLNPGK
jgi:hypothetical protein